MPHVTASALTAAVLRVAARVFWGLGPRPADAEDYETTGSDEPPETEGPLRRVPDTMTAVPALLLTAALAVGVGPGFGDLLAAALAALAVTRPDRGAAPRWTRPLRHLQSGHLGDYVAWLLLGATTLAALALPGVLGG